MSAEVSVSASTKDTGYLDRNNNGKMDRYEDPLQPLDTRVDDIIERLRLTQKVSLVTGTGFNLEIGGSEKVPGAAGSTPEIPELGIPALVLADGPAGLRIEPKRKGDDKAYYATAFPIATVLASTWNSELVEEVGKAMGEEVKEYGVDLFLAPGMNIHYNPLGGRNFEYYSEDPVLSGVMAASIVNGVQSYGVGATIKHFVANNAETSRMWLDAHLNERAFREIYLRGFEIAIKQSMPWAIMTSYNKVNGVYTSQDFALLKTVLRDEWGYDGFVMTDWFAGDDVVAQMRAGNDLIMPGMPDQREAIEKAVSSGELSEDILDRNLSNILKILLTSPVWSDYQYSNQPDLKAHAQTARQAAAEGVVLLKNNDDALPISSDTKIAAFGNTSYDFIAGGTGSGDVNEAYTVSLVEGLENGQLAVDDKVKSVYVRYLKSEKAKLPEKKNLFDLLPPIPELSPDKKQLSQSAKNNDIAIITLGRNSGEFFDRKVEGDFDLTAAEQQLITDVSDAFHKVGKKVVVILNIGNVIETASWKDKVDAIVLPWQGGQEAGNAVVDIISGKTNPSGRLVTTFPVKYVDNPSSESFPGTPISDETLKDPYLGIFVGKHSQLEYNNGIYVGYRYYDTFEVPISYEFGYGLSYSDFAYSDLKINPSQDEGDYTVSLTVKNTGRKTGKEVVQLYVKKPDSKVETPSKELAGFVKTSLLLPGESESVSLKIEAENLASFIKNKRAWIVQPGQYKFMLGASSHDIRLQKVIYVKSEILEREIIANFAPATPVDEIKRE